QRVRLLAVAVPWRRHPAKDQGRDIQSGLDQSARRILLLGAVASGKRAFRVGLRSNDRSFKKARRSPRERGARGGSSCGDLGRPRRGARPERALSRATIRFLRGIAPGPRTRTLAGFGRRSVPRRWVVRYQRRVAKNGGVLDSAAQRVG